MERIFSQIRNNVILYKYNFGKVTFLVNNTTNFLVIARVTLADIYYEVMFLIKKAEFLYLT